MKMEVSTFHNKGVYWYRIFGGPNSHGLRGQDSIPEKLQSSNFLRLQRFRGKIFPNLRRDRAKRLLRKMEGRGGLCWRKFGGEFPCP